VCAGNLCCVGTPNGAGGCCATGTTVCGINCCSAGQTCQSGICEPFGGEFVAPEDTTALAAAAVLRTAPRPLAGDADS
jgi:hypothetical protein